MLPSTLIPFQEFLPPLREEAIFSSKGMTPVSRRKTTKQPHIFLLYRRVSLTRRDVQGPNRSRRPLLFSYFFLFFFFFSDIRLPLSEDAYPSLFGEPRSDLLPGDPLPAHFLVDVNRLAFFPSFWVSGRLLLRDK